MVSTEVRHGRLGTLGVCGARADSPSWTHDLLRLEGAGGAERRLLLADSPCAAVPGPGETGRTRPAGRGGGGIRPPTPPLPDHPGRPGGPGRLAHRPAHPVLRDA